MTPDARHRTRQSAGDCVPQKRNSIPGYAKRHPFRSRGIRLGFPGPLTGSVWTVRNLRDIALPAEALWSIRTASRPGNTPRFAYVPIGYYTYIPHTQTILTGAEDPARVRYTPATYLTLVMILYAPVLITKLYRAFSFLLPTWVRLDPARVPDSARILPNRTCLQILAN